MKLNTTTGEITCFQGDSGMFYLSGLPVNSTLYFSAYNDKYKIISETSSSVDNSGNCKLFIPAEFTDKLTIPKNEDLGEYYYGLKVVYNDDDLNRIERSCVLENHDMSEPNILTVLPKRTEGGTSND